MITKDYLPHHKEITLYQDDTMIRVNTDTEVLGEFLEVYKEDIVLDIGTNQGALLLYANMYSPKKLIGLDINQEALKLAKMNMEANDIKNYELIHRDILKYRGKEVDVIICNPPYFKTKEDNKSKNDYKNLAKHEGSLTLSKLVEAISLNLKDNGTLFFLFLSQRLEEVIIELNKNHLYIKEMQMVFDSNKEYSNVFMVKCKKNVKQNMQIKKPVIIKR